MAKTTDTVAKRFATLLSSGIGVRLSAQVKAQEDKLGPDANRVLPEWADPNTAVLTLNSSSIFDQAAMTAFNKAGLDPKDPIHWYALMILFSWAHFGKWSGRGRPKKWTSKKYDELLRDFSKIRNEKPEIPDIEVCRILKKRYNAKYDGTSAERLAKEAKKAQDPKFNPSLAHLLQTMLKGARVGHQRQNLAWSPEVEAEERIKYLKLILELSGPRKKLKAGPDSAHPQSESS